MSYLDIAEQDESWLASASRLPRCSGRPWHRSCRDAARPGGGSAMRLPRAGAGSFVQYLDPSEPESRARLDASALFARKAAPAVGARCEAQGWAWRDARRSASKRAHSDIV